MRMAPAATRSMEMASSSAPSGIGRPVNDVICPLAPAGADGNRMAASAINVTTTTGGTYRPALIRGALGTGYVRYTTGCDAN